MRLLLVLLILLCGMFALLHTGPVQDRIAAYVSDRVSSADRTVQIEGLRARWPFHINLRSLHVSDQDGLWLEIERAHLSWSWRSNTIRIKKLRADRLELSRLPAPQEKPEAPEKPFNPPAVNLALDELVIDQFNLDAGFTGE